LCHAHLTSVSIGNATLEECIPCAGIWVRAADFDEICADNQSQTAAMSLPMPPMPADDQDDVPVHYLKCPTCGQIMNRTVYGQVSGVIVSVCRDHGIWFDHGGLRRVIELVRSGAIQKAQARQAEESQREEALAAQDKFLDSLPSIWTPCGVAGRYRNQDVIGAVAALIRHAGHI
jgi:Zn-finger nucleic acid-binding protein